MAGRVCSHLKPHCQPLSKHWFRATQQRCSAAAHASPTSNAVPVPLCKRPPKHQDALRKLLSWQQSVEQQIDHMGDQFEVEDQGPNAQDLKEVQYATGQQWLPCQWRQLQMELRLAAHRQQDTNCWQVKLRAPVQQLHDWWQQRLQERMPFQYLISTAHWRDYILSIGPGVLIPRPETEIFPELVQQALASRPALAALPWVDLGTGSGAIAISVADVLRKHSKDARMFAVDVSPVAAAYARANASSTQLDHVVTVLEGSWLSPVMQHLSQHNLAQQTQGLHSGNDDLNHNTPPTQHPSHSTSSQLDLGDESSKPSSEGLQANVTTSAGSGISIKYSSWPVGVLGGIVSNPPYIPRDVMEAGLQAEVGRHEPWLALDGGPGPGLDSIQVICQQAATALTPGGFLALETAGDEQAEEVALYLRSMHLQQGPVFEDVQTIADCYGKIRFVTASKCNAT